MIGEIHEEGKVEDLNPFLLMGPETPMNKIFSKGIKYDRKSALIKEKGGQKDKSKDQSFMQKGKQTPKPPQLEYYHRQAKTNHKLTEMRPLKKEEIYDTAPDRKTVET
ncbi:uncharacterized [Tachysurus ichikawai]